MREEIQASIIEQTVVQISGSNITLSNSESIKIAACFPIDSGGGKHGCDGLLYEDATYATFFSGGTLFT